MLESAGASLVPANSFHLLMYLKVRENYTVRGISIINGDVIGGDLPRSSTSKEGSPGQLCIRVLTTGLLYFYSKSAAVEIFAELILYSIFYYK